MNISELHDHEHTHTSGVTNHLVAERSSHSDVNRFQPRKKRITNTRKRFLNAPRGVLRNCIVKRANTFNQKQLKAAKRESVNAKAPLKSIIEEHDSDILNIDEPVELNITNRKSTVEKGRLLHKSICKPTIQTSFNVLVPDSIPVNSINTVKRVVRVQEHSKRGLLKEIGIQANLDKPKTVSIGIQVGSPSLQLQRDRPIPQIVVDRPPVKSYWTHPVQYNNSHTITSGALQQQQQSQQPFIQVPYQVPYHIQQPFVQVPFQSQQQQQYTGRQKRNFIRKQRSIVRRSQRQ